MKSWHVLVPLSVIAVTALILQKRAHDADFAHVREELDALEQAPRPSEERPSGPRVLAAAPPVASAPRAASIASAQPAEVAVPAAAPLHKVTSADMRDHYDIAFTGEYEDGSWAPSARSLATQRLKATLPPGSALRSIDCRTSMCRVETSHPDMQHYRQFVESSFRDPSSSVWNAATFSSLVDDTSGNLVVVSYVAREGQPLPQLDFASFAN
jgi:hypothetical protein